MTMKLVEIRDAATFIPALAVGHQYTRHTKRSQLGWIHDRAAWLVLVYVVVIGTWPIAARGFQHLAEGNPVLHSKNVPVLNYSVGTDAKLARFPLIEEFFAHNWGLGTNKWASCKMKFGSWCYHAGPLRFLFGLSFYVRQFSSFYAFDSRDEGHMERWTFPSISEHTMNEKWFIKYRLTIYPNESYPSTLFKCHLLLEHLELFGGDVGSTFGSIGRFLKLRILLDYLSELTTHYLKLTVVDTQSDDSYNSENSVDYKLRKLNPSKLTGKFSGSVVLILGSLIGVASNLVLGWSGWRCRYWRLRTRLGIWVVSWIVALVIVCHGASILLGIN